MIKSIAKVINYVLFLLACTICRIHYVKNSETMFNLGLNNHRKDVKNPSAIEVYNSFNTKKNHRFSKHEKFLLIVLLRNIKTTSMETLKTRLKKRPKFYIKRLTEFINPLTHFRPMSHFYTL